MFPLAFTVSTGIYCLFCTGFVLLLLAVTTAIRVKSYRRERQALLDRVRGDERASNVFESATGGEETLELTLASEDDKQRTDDRE